MNVKSHLVRELLTAIATNPLLGGLQMTVHMFVVRILRHVHLTEPTTEHFRLVGELIFANVSFVFFKCREAQTTVLAMSNVKDAEIDFRSPSFLVHASVFHHSSMCCVLLATRLTNEAMRI